MGQHNVKIPEARWKAALARARSEGRTLTSVIDDALAAYVGEAVIQVIADDRMPPGTAMLASPGKQPVIMTGLSAETPRRPRKAAVPQAAFSDPPVNPLPAPQPETPRCTHPGVRITGGWCVPCRRKVLPGGG